MKLEACLLVNDDDIDDLQDRLKSMDENPVTELDTVGELHVGDGCINIDLQGDLASVYGSLVLTTSKDDKQFVRDLIEQFNMASKYRADGRGRITLGKQYAGKDVDIIVVSSEEVDGK